MADSAPSAVERAAALSIWKGPVTPRTISGGITNINLLVEDAGERFVVRVGEDIPAHQIMRFNERAATKAAHAAGLSPEVVHTEPGIMVIRHIEGRTCAESDELIDAIFAELYEPSNVYVHHWTVGDLVIWDNLLLQHGRPANPNSVRRSLRRVMMNTVTTPEIIAGTGFDPAVRARRASPA